MHFHLLWRSCAVLKEANIIANMFVLFKNSTLHVLERTTGRTLGNASVQTSSQWGMQTDLSYNETACASLKTAARCIILAASSVTLLSTQYLQYKCIWWRIACCSATGQVFGLASVYLYVSVWHRGIQTSQNTGSILKNRTLQCVGSLWWQCTLLGVVLMGGNYKW